MIRILTLVRVISIFLLVLSCESALADQVVPTERVRNGVSIRAEQSSDSTFLGLLRPGESLEFIENSGRWREVRLSPTETGFVSSSFTRRVSDAVAQADGPLSDRDVNELRIHYLPIGAGSCTVIECPGADASPMIVDCGSLNGTRGPGDLDEAAATAAVGEILDGHDVPVNLVVSHADKDHMDYLDEVLSGRDVGQIWLGGAFTDYTSDFQTLINGFDDGSNNIHKDLPADFHNDQFELADELSCGIASTFILTVNSGTSKNGNSLVLAIDYEDFSSTFTGDAEASTEKQAIANYDGAVKTTVLTGSHHGADTKGSNGSAKDVGANNRSGWPQATLPDVVIYSHGRRFGHPRCAITSDYHPSLARVDNHPVHCGENNDDNTPMPRQTELAEYSTEVSGKITVTTNGVSPLNIHCGGTVGCAEEIEF